MAKVESPLSGKSSTYDLGAQLSFFIKETRIKEDRRRMLSNCFKKESNEEQSRSGSCVNGIICSRVAEHRDPTDGLRAGAGDSPFLSPSLVLSLDELGRGKRSGTRSLVR